LASNGFAVKRIYMIVFSGRGRAPKVREAGNARGQRRASGAVQSYSNNKASDLLGKFPRGLRLRASLRVSLRMNLSPMQGVLGIAVK
jgi:hypothetical protein